MILAFLSGILMAVQGSLNAALGKVVGLLEAAFIVHATGLIVLSVALFGLRLGKGAFSLPNVPWYLYLGGLLGVLIVYLVAASIPNVGVGTATTAIIIGQVLTALVIDHFGLFGLEENHFVIRQGVGLVLLAIGGKLLLQ
ncbi:MAG: DMT family transporter [Sporomusaceae bacterium]|nr:DMT family transporter [Sporomusaceae bacterium]